MPMLVTSHLPKPKSWDEFEDICLAISKIKWNYQNFSRNGRSGQKQDGVDIFSCGLSNSIGIQCKNTYLTQLTIKIIESEIKNAEKFTPGLKELHIATTSSRDTNIQKEVETLSQSRGNDDKFRVFLIFWEDIEQELSKNEGEIARFYPYYFQSKNKKTLLKNNKKTLLKNKDIQCLTSVLEVIDIDALKEDLYWAPKNISFEIITSYRLVKKKVHSPLFCLNDKSLKEAFYCVFNSWLLLIGQIEVAPYQDNGRYDKELIFKMPVDHIDNIEDRLSYDYIGDLAQELTLYLDDLYKFIREKYPEIDLIETNKKARNYLNQA